MKKVKKKVKKILKNIYYDKYACPRQRKSNKKHYGTDDMFDILGIEISSYCNLRCKWCPNSKYERGLKKNKTDLPIKYIKKIIKDLKKINYRGHIQLHFYNEPLADERLIKIIKLIKKNVPKCKIDINTNGIFLTIDMFKKLNDAGTEIVNYSQYTPEIPKNVKELMNHLRKFPEKYKTKFHCRIFNDEQTDFAVYDRDGVVGKNILDRPPCIYPKQQMTIDFMGNAVLCCNDYHSSVKFGNIKDSELMDIWNSRRYKKVRKMLKNKKFVFPICKYCVGKKAYKGP